MAKPNVAVGKAHRALLRLLGSLRALVVAQRLFRPHWGLVKIALSALLLCCSQKTRYGHVCPYGKDCYNDNCWFQDVHDVDTVSLFALLLERPDTNFVVVESRVQDIRGWRAGMESEVELSHTIV
jgi:hypothetical protein